MPRWELQLQSEPQWYVFSSWWGCQVALGGCSPVLEKVMKPTPLVAAFLTLLATAAWSRLGLPRITVGRDSTAATAAHVRETQQGKHHEFPILPLAVCFGTTHYSVRRVGTAERAASTRSKG